MVKHCLSWYRPPAAAVEAPAQGDAASRRSPLFTIKRDALPIVSIISSQACPSRCKCARLMKAMGSSRPGSPINETSMEFIVECISARQDYGRCCCRPESEATPMLRNAPCRQQRVDAPMARAVSARRRRPLGQAPRRAAEPTPCFSARAPIDSRLSTRDEAVPARPGSVENIAAVSPRRTRLQSRCSRRRRLA